MESITIYPKNEKQKVLLKSLLKEMDVQFKTRKITDNTLLTENEFYAKIDKSVQQAENGESKLLSEERQKGLLGL